MIDYEMEKEHLETLAKKYFPELYKKSKFVLISSLAREFLCFQMISYKKSLIHFENLIREKRNNAHA